MDITILVTHELEVHKRHSDRLRADAKETADIDDGRPATPRTMNVIELTNLMVVGSVNRRTFKDSRCQFCGCEAYVIGMIHWIILLVCYEEVTPARDICSLAQELNVVQKSCAGIAKDQVCGEALGSPIFSKVLN